MNIDRLVSFAAATIVAVIAVSAIIRFIMPPLADATDSVTSSSDRLNADVDQVIVISAVTMPDDRSVDVWAKNVGSAAIDELSQTIVEFGRESNPLPYNYGGPGCAAPCWWYEATGTETWAQGETLALHIELNAAAEAGALHRVRVQGRHGGQASETLRAP